MDPLQDRIAAFVKHVDELTAKHWQDQNYTFAPPPTHRADYISDKWCRIITVEEWNGVKKDTSVFCFVCLSANTTKKLGTVKPGDIHKADGFKSAAKHARGSVFAEDFNGCANSYGVTYLRR